MAELRKDYLLDRWVIISQNRNKRPKQFVQDYNKDKGVCFFCRGNEQMTPPEIGRFGNWRMRWFENKFSAVGSSKVINTDWTVKEARGFHEVIVETPHHEKQLWDLKTKDFKDLFWVYENRINELSKKKGIKYVCVFKNHGKRGGTSIVHSHSQIIALHVIPHNVKEKIKAVKRHDRMVYKKIIAKEKRSQRLCFETENIIAYAPFASRFNYEVVIFPKKYRRTLSEMDEKEKYELAFVLRKILRKLKKINADYNFYLHYAPKDSELHFHISVEPRTATWAGFELSSGIIINSVAPEDAAQYYRK